MHYLLHLDSNTVFSKSQACALVYVQTFYVCTCVFTDVESVCCICVFKCAVVLACVLRRKTLRVMTSMLLCKNLLNVSPPTLPGRNSVVLKFKRK